MSNEIEIFNTLNKETRTVSARELHERLEITERFNSWFGRMCQYGFSEESKDFCGCKVFNTLANQYIDDYNISIDMAKEICMIQRNDAGKMFRRYFIEVEKEWNNSPMMQIIRQSKSPYETSLALAELFKKEKEEKALLIEQRDKAEDKFNTLVHNDNNTYTATDIAKDLGFRSAIAFNQWLKDIGFQYKQGKHWVVRAKYAEEGLVNIKLKDTGNGFNVKTMQFTNKGKLWITDKYRETHPNTLQITYL